jgi:hypothetical protein
LHGSDRMALSAPGASGGGGAGLRPAGADAGQAPSARRAARRRGSGAARPDRSTAERRRPSAGFGKDARAAAAAKAPGSGSTLCRAYDVETLAA